MITAAGYAFLLQSLVLQPLNLSLALPGDDRVLRNPAAACPEGLPRRPRPASCLRGLRVFGGWGATCAVHELFYPGTTPALGTFGEFGQEGGYREEEPIGKFLLSGR